MLPKYQVIIAVILSRAYQVSQRKVEGTRDSELAMRKSESQTGPASLSGLAQLQCPGRSNFLLPLLMLPDVALEVLLGQSDQSLRAKDMEEG